jgi:hypothetical protein
MAPFFAVFLFLAGLVVYLLIERSNVFAYNGLSNATSTKAEKRKPL